MKRFSAPLVASIESSAFAAQVPVAQNDTAAAFGVAPVVIRVLENDYDPDPTDTIGISSLTGPDVGWNEITGPGEITFHPTGTFAGVAQFTYTIPDAVPGETAGRAFHSFRIPAIYDQDGTMELAVAATIRSFKVLGNVAAFADSTRSFSTARTVAAQVALSNGTQGLVFIALP